MRSAFACVGAVSIVLALTVVFSVVLVFAGCGKDVAR